MKKLILMQAGMLSPHLSGKALLPLAGKPLLQRTIQRVRVATDHPIVVATSYLSFDDPIADLCCKLSVPCFRGHPTDLLERHYHAARQWGADVVVRIPSKCPLIDPKAIQRVLNAYDTQIFPWDYLSNLHPATWPDGNDVEVMQFDALERTFLEATAPNDRDRVTSYLWDGTDRFWVGNVRWETGLDYSTSHRFVVERAEDYELARCVYDELCTGAEPSFTLQDVLALLEERPEIFAINARHAGLNWYRHRLSALRMLVPRRPQDVEPAA